MRRPASLAQGTRTASAIAMFLLATGGCQEDPALAPSAVDSPEGLIQVLEQAYQGQDVGLLASLLAHDPAGGVEFRFTLLPTLGAEEELWGFETEVSLHARMFDPENIPPTDPELPQELWVRAIDVSFRKATEFVEPDSIYQTVENPDGLDGERWRAFEATYLTDAHFELESGSSFTIEEEELRFLILEDLQKNTGDEGRFLLLRWEDRCSTASTGEDCWNEIKRLYLGV